MQNQLDMLLELPRSCAKARQVRQGGKLSDQSNAAASSPEPRGTKQAQDTSRVLSHTKLGDGCLNSWTTTEIIAQIELVLVYSF